MDAVPCETDDVESVLQACLVADGHPPLSDHKLFVVTGSVPGVVGCWERRGALAVVAAAAVHEHADRSRHWTLEVAVHPRARPDEERPAIAVGRTLVPDGEAHTLWCFRPEQNRAARALGYRSFRDLLLMRMSLPARTPVPVAGYRLRVFRAGEDEPAIVAINNRVFATHRENDRMTAASLAVETGSMWFDPEALIMAEGDGDVAGFCWMRPHEGGIGEIHLVGVDTGHRGRGLGRWLVLAGLELAHRRFGATTGQLWTDGDNVAAVALYRSIGFETVLVNEEMAPAGQPNG